MNLPVTPPTCFSDSYTKFGDDPSILAGKDPYGVW